MAIKIIIDLSKNNSFLSIKVTPVCCLPFKECADFKQYGHFFLWQRFVKSRIGLAYASRNNSFINIYRRIDKMSIISYSFTA